MFRRDLGLCLLATVVMVTAAPPARAQDARTVKRVEDINRAAMEDYDLLEFDSAKKQLGDALALIKKHKLEKHKVAARTHLNMAIVYGAGIGDQDTALLELMSALEIDPDTKLDPAYRSPALQKTFEQARSSVGGAKGETAAPGGVTAALKHVPIEEARAGEPLVIAARAGGEILDRTTQVILRYRPAGAEAYTTLTMHSLGGGEYQGTIPEAATRGETVHYFVEARAATGKVLATAGSLDAPNIVSLVRPPPGTRRPDDPAEDEDPLHRKAASAGGGTGTGDDETEVARKKQEAHHKFYVSVSVGSGLGYISGGETEVSHQEVTCCVAIAPFHIMPEVGLWLSRQLTLSLVGRIGFPLGADVDGAATLAAAALLRATYLFGKDGGGYVHGDIGGGFIRHTVKLNATSSMSAGGSTDTFVTGPLLIGAGAGWIVPLGKGPLRFVADLNVLAGIPIIDTIGSGPRASKPGFALNGDLSLGLGVAF